MRFTAPPPSLIPALALSGKCLAEWVLDNKNKDALIVAINEGIKKYLAVREDRKNMFGDPKTFYPETSVDSRTASLQKPAEKTYTDQAVDMLTRTKYFAHYLFAATTAAAQELITSNSAELYRKTFSVINHDNARIAFLYIGRLPSGWNVESYGGLFRASLTTMIFCEVFSSFAKEKSANKKSEVPVDGDFDLVEDDNEHGFSRIVDLFNSQEIDPKCKMTHAKEIFVAFSGTEKVQPLVSELNAYLLALPIAPPVAKPK